MAGIATLALAYVLSQFYRSFLAVLTPALTAELGATKAQLSFASGAFFITFALALPGFLFLPAVRRALAAPRTAA